MAAEANTKDIFVGRDAERQAFAATLQELATSKRQDWTDRLLFRRSQPARSRARVFLIHGSGGMGKTSLLRQFARQCVERGDVKWVLLNWDDMHDAGNLPQDFPTLTVSLHNTIARQMGQQAQKYFQTFITTHENHGKTQQKVKLYTPQARTE